ncbi:MAG: hypothetical protein KDC80_07055 [Saprospiraceae bacterium]|nr:hypothetical protein [Saprospiraceae bacterium]
MGGRRDRRRKQRGRSIRHSVGVSRDRRSPMSDARCGVFGIRGLVHLVLLVHLAPFKQTGEGSKEDGAYGIEEELSNVIGM